MNTEKEQPTLTAETFSCDGGTPYNGYHDASEDWNGWACPYFEQEEVDKMEADGLVKKVEGGYVDAYEDEADAEVFEPVQKVTTDGMKMLYPIGSYYWVWSAHQFKR